MNRARWGDCEVALITRGPRAATVRAGPRGCQCFTLARDAFDAVAGPMVSLLKPHLARSPQDGFGWVSVASNFKPAPQLERQTQGKDLKGTIYS